MAKNEEMNEYRSERKKRLAKSAKKASKKTVDSVKVVSGIVYSLLIVGAIAILCFALYQFGVPQKLLPAVKVDGKTYSVAEYEYYYMNVFQTYANNSSSAGFTLFDHSKDPSTQMTKDEDDNDISYAELFRKNVIENLKTSNYYLSLAKDAGMELDEEGKKAVDDTIAELEGYANQYGYSTSRYISLLYGKGLNLKMFREMLEDQQLVSQYLTAMSKDIIDNVTDEQVQAEYDKDPAAHQVVDIRLLGKKLPTDSDDAKDKPTETAEEINAKAEEMLGKITDEKSFIELAKDYCDEGDKETFENESATLLQGLQNSIVKSNIGEDLAKWLFSSKRVEGDKRTYSTDGYTYVLYVIKPAYRNDEPLVNARHILISFDDIAKELEENKDEESTDKKDSKELTASDGTKVTAAGTEVSAEVVLAAYEQAKKVLDEYKAGETTETAFAALAEKYSADTGSVGENTAGGGLYENIERGKMVAEFENWVYDAKREAGDTGIIKTTYGYHIMYFVSKNDAPSWKIDIKNTLANAAMEEKEAELDKANDKTAEAASCEKWGYSESLKLVNKLYVGNDHDHD